MSSEKTLYDVANEILDNSRKGICGGCGATLSEALVVSNIAAALDAERAKFAAFAGPDGEPLAVLMKGKCGQWPTDEMLEKKIPDGTMVYWILPATSALAAAKEQKPCDGK